MPAGNDATVPVPNPIRAAVILRNTTALSGTSREFALDATCRIPDCIPSDCGTSLRLIVQLPPGVSVAGQLSPVTENGAIVLRVPGVIADAEVFEMITWA